MLNRVRGERGQTTTEYAIILAVITAGVISLLSVLSLQVRAEFLRVAAFLVGG